MTKVTIPALQQMKRGGRGTRAESEGKFLQLNRGQRKRSVKAGFKPAQ